MILMILMVVKVVVLVVGWRWPWRWRLWLWWWWKIKLSCESYLQIRILPLDDLCSYTCVQHDPDLRPAAVALMNLMTGSIRSILQAFSGCDLCRGVIKPLGGPDQSTRCLFLEHFVAKGCQTWKKRLPTKSPTNLVPNFRHNCNMLIIHFVAQNLRTFYIHESVQNRCIWELDIISHSYLGWSYIRISACFGFQFWNAVFEKLQLCSKYIKTYWCIWCDMSYSGVRSQRVVPGNSPNSCGTRTSWAVQTAQPRHTPYKDTYSC